MRSISHESIIVLTTSPPVVVLRVWAKLKVPLTELSCFLKWVIENNLFGSALFSIRRPKYCVVEESIIGLQGVA